MRVSEKRANQARLNGAKSKGPNTPQGLDRCRKASVTHGAYIAQISTLPNEDQSQYEANWHSCLDQFAPRNYAETGVVALIADAIWRANRLYCAANAEVHSKMRAIRTGSSVNQTLSEIYLRAENASENVLRLESRARHFTREIARLISILDKMQNWGVSDKASRMSNEIIDNSMEKRDQPNKEEGEEKAKPAEPVPAAAPAEPAPARKPPQGTSKLSRKQRKLQKR